AGNEFEIHIPQEEKQPIKLDGIVPLSTRTHDLLTRGEIHARDRDGLIVISGRLQKCPYGSPGIALSQGPLRGFFIDWGLLYCRLRRCREVLRGKLAENANEKQASESCRI